MGYSVTQLSDEIAASTDLCTSTAETAFAESLQGLPSIIQGGLYFLQTLPSDHPSVHVTCHQFSLLEYFRLLPRLLDV